MEKYKIIECLAKFTREEYRIVIKALPGIIGKSTNTFWNYAKIDIDSKMDIPYGIVVTLEQFFKLLPGELSNISYQVKTYKKVIAKYKAKNE